MPQSEDSALFHLGELFAIATKVELAVARSVRDNCELHPLYLQVVAASVDYLEALESIQAEMPKPPPPSPGRPPTSPP